MNEAHRPPTSGGYARAGASARWIDLRARLISAAVLAPVGLACLWFGAPAWTVLVAIAFCGLAAEWVRLGGRRGHPLGAAVLMHAAAGVLYIGPAAVAMLWLRADPVAGRANTIFLLLVVWASDIGAYAAGRLLGGKLLAPAISPGKTWSGAAGGLAAAALTGLLVAWAMAGLPLGARAALVAAGLGVVAQLGDLLESLIKRRFGVKDSSRLIPGHGGLLDRLDAVLTAAPAAALLALLLGRGVIIWA